MKREYKQALYAPLEGIIQTTPRAELTGILAAITWGRSPPVRHRSISKGPSGSWGNPGAPSGPLGAPRGPFGAFWGDPGLSTRGLAFVTCLALSKLLGRSRASSGDLEGFRVILKRRNRLGAETLISQKRTAWRLPSSRGEFLKKIIVLGLG